LGIVAVGVVRESRKFRAPIGRIARSSLRQHSFLVTLGYQQTIDNLPARHRVDTYQVECE